MNPTGQNQQLDSEVSLIFCPPGPSPLLPAVRFRAQGLRWQTHRHGDDEVHLGDSAPSVLRVPPPGPEPGPPPPDQQPVPAARGAPRGGRGPQHELLTPTQRKKASGPVNHSPRARSPHAHSPHVLCVAVWL